MESNHIPDKIKQILQALFETLNPFSLQEQLKENVITILRETRAKTRQQTPVAFSEAMVTLNYEATG